MTQPDSNSEVINESAQSTVEYALIVTFMVMLVIAVMVSIGPQLRNFLQRPVSEDQQDDRRAAISSAVYK